MWSASTSVLSVLRRLSLPRVGTRPTAPSPGKPGAGTAEVIADVTAYDELRQALDGCDALVHLAARPGPKGWPAHEVHNLNVVASYNALERGRRGRHRPDLPGLEHKCHRRGLFASAPTLTISRSTRSTPTYNEDALQALQMDRGGRRPTSVCRGNGNLTVGSLRLHYLCPGPGFTSGQGGSNRAAVTAATCGATRPWKRRRVLARRARWELEGHEVFFVVAPRTAALKCQQRNFAPSFTLKCALRHEFLASEGLFSLRKGSGTAWLGARHRGGRTTR